jgi:hypothetical protein
MRWAVCGRCLLRHTLVTRGYSTRTVLCVCYHHPLTGVIFLTRSEIFLPVFTTANPPHLQRESRRRPAHPPRPPRSTHTILRSTQAGRALARLQSYPDGHRQCCRPALLRTALPSPFTHNLTHPPCDRHEAEFTRQARPWAVCPVGVQIGTWCSLVQALNASFNPHPHKPSPHTLAVHLATPLPASLSGVSRRVSLRWRHAAQLSSFFRIHAPPTLKHPSSERHSPSRYPLGRRGRFLTM